MKLSLTVAADSYPYHYTTPLILFTSTVQQLHCAHRSRDRLLTRNRQSAKLTLNLLFSLNSTVVQPGRAHPECVAQTSLERRCLQMCQYLPNKRTCRAPPFIRRRRTACSLTGPCVPIFSLEVAPNVVTSMREANVAVLVGSSYPRPPTSGPILNFTLLVVPIPKVHVGASIAVHKYGNLSLCWFGS